MPDRRKLDGCRPNASGLDRREMTFGAAAMLAGATTQSPTPTEAAFTAERIILMSRGKPIRTVVFRPVSNARGSGIVYLHGSGSIGPNQLRFAQSFAAQGYVSVVPTYLDAAADDSVRAAPIMNAWRACGADAIEWLIAQGIEPRRTALVGYSLGSFIAAAIGVAGGWDVYIPRPPARRIPILIVRAERDTHVRPSSTERWRQFLTDRGVSVRMRLVRGAGHIMNQRQWDSVSNHAIEFLDGNIGRADQV